MGNIVLRETSGERATNKGAPLTNAELDANLLALNNVLSYENLAAFPVEGEVDKLYIDIATGYLYRYDTTYHQVGGSGTGGGAYTIGPTAPANPANGDGWFDTTSGIEYTYITTGATSQWVESAAVMNSYSTIRSVESIATEGQTTWEVAYTPGFIRVYMNGYRLYTPDFTADDGVSVVLTTAASQGDELKFEIIGTFAIADVALQADLSTARMPLGMVYSANRTDTPSGSIRLDGTEYIESLFPTFFAACEDGKIQTCTYAEYAAELTANGGNCGRVAIDTVARTFKAPTVVDATFFAQMLTGVVGRYGTAGLPNITGEDTIVLSTATTRTGAFTPSSVGGGNASFGTSGAWGGHVLRFDASYSNALYGASDTVTPRHIKYPYFMVVANVAVPASEAQYNQFLTNLGLKADFDDMVAAFALKQDVLSQEYGAVGTYALLIHTTAGTLIVAGNTYAGSVLRPAGLSTNNTTNSGSSGYCCVTGSAIAGKTTVSGTWRAMGDIDTAYNYKVTVFLRIA